MSKLPARLVYSPKTYVYTKNQAGQTYNLTNYVVSGEVRRLINQVSTAKVVLRNPQKVFTGGGGMPRAFHPMDPITIYLERLPGFPVKVFTGYLDESPYYQMYPGPITLTASCTLKRLLYSYFDPSLPFVLAFFQKYGWTPTGSGTIISQAAVSNAPLSGNEILNLQDGSLGKLLWAVLTDIANWSDSKVYIENLPSGENGIAPRMAALMKGLQKDQAQAQTDFTSFLQRVIGAGSQGSGGGNPGGIGDTTVLNKAIPAIIDAANQAGLNPLFILAVSYNECGFNPSEIDGWSPTDDTGWFQFHFGAGNHNGTSTPYPGLGPYSTAQARDPGFAAGVFCKAVIHKGGVPAATSQWASFAASVQVSVGYPQWDANMPTVQKYYDQYRNRSVGQAISLGGSQASSTQQGHTAPAQGSGSATSDGYVNPLAQAKSITGERIDQGIDYSMQSGSPIVAIGDATLVGAQTNWYRGQPLYVFKLTSGPLKDKYWYIAEQVVLTPALHNGSTVKAGDTIATFASSGTGLEIGWASNAAGTTLAVANGGYTEGSSTAAGLNFNDLMKALGGPAGKPQGSTMGTLPSGWPTNFNNITVSGGSSGGTTGSMTSGNTAQAFITELQFPSVMDMVTAVALGTEHLGLMHDQSVLPFVQQIAQASLRSFQSLPNGDFYAFYPDYFGEMGHHIPYWYIRDIEILDGGINLNDNALSTHVFAVGDNTLLGTGLVGGASGNSELINSMFSTGAINIFNAFVGSGIIDTSTPAQKSDGLNPGIMTAEEAVKFLQRYGARPLVQQYPMVRSSLFEMLLAYQQFMYAWASQFQTPFTFTFMPELFPGGKVGFPDHGVQMYINSVTHAWDYEQGGGFTTTAELSAPSLMQGVNSANAPDLPPFMVSALIEPIREAATAHTSAAPPSATSQVINQAVSTVDSTVNSVLSALGTSLFDPPKKSR